MSLTNHVLTDPLGILAITTIVVAAYFYQRRLTWGKYRRLHSLKVRLAPFLDAYWPATKEVGYRNESPEYVTHLDETPREVFESLVKAGGSPHLINSVKYRTHRGGRDPMVFSVVFNVGSQEQTECYAFEGPRGGTDIYSHVETSILDVSGHLEDGGVPGDPRYIVRDALGVR